MNRFRDWGFELDRPLVIAGPCTVESEAQVMQTALGLKNADLEILRGGIWKARTSPNSFQGHGKQALPWLKKAGAAINKPVAVEVATAKHVEDCLEEGIDYLWVGARTSANPFAVQEIADALKGVDIPVFVKNPINPDLKLWMGAIERIQRASIKKIGAIHRGFSHYGASIYRNQPIWPIAIEFRQEMAEIPMIADPSHIAGKRKLLFSVAQMALDLGFDGLMFETHISPDEAWSDAAQQVTPKKFKEITVKLRQRLHTLDDGNLTELRGALDEMDLILMQLIGDRMELVREIGAIKNAENVAIYQPEQLRDMMDARLELAEKHGLSKEFIHNLFESVHTESIRQQCEVWYKNKNKDLFPSESF